MEDFINQKNVHITSLWKCHFDSLFILPIDQGFLKAAMSLYHLLDFLNVLTVFPETSSLTDKSYSFHTSILKCINHLKRMSKKKKKSSMETDGIQWQRWSNQS